MPPSALSPQSPEILNHGMSKDSSLNVRETLDNSSAGPPFDGSSHIVMIKRSQVSTPSRFKGALNSHVNGPPPQFTEFTKSAKPTYFFERQVRKQRGHRAWRAPRRGGESGWFWGFRPKDPNQRRLGTVAETKSASRPPMLPDGLAPPRAWALHPRDARAPSAEALGSFAASRLGNAAGSESEQASFFLLP